MIKVIVFVKLKAMTSILYIISAPYGNVAALIAFNKESINTTNQIFPIL